MRALFISLSLLMVSYETMAMKKGLEEKYADFEGLPFAALEHALDTPEQACASIGAKNQVAFILAIEGKKFVTDFAKFDDCPVTFSCPLVVLTLNPSLFPGIPRGEARPDRDLCFRIGPTPKQMVEYINKNLPADCKYLFKEFSSKNKFERAQLIKIVEESHKLGQGTLVYTQVGSIGVKFYLVVRISKDKNNFLVLDSDGKGVDRLKPMSVEKMLDMMNAMTLVERVKPLNFFGVKPTAANSATVASTESIFNWMPFTLICPVSK